MRNECPKCKSSWIGEEIPEEHREEYYGGSTHFKREIGIDGGQIGIYDGTVAVRCPDCGEDMPVSEHPVHLEMFEAYKKVMNGN